MIAIREEEVVISVCRQARGYSLLGKKDKMRVAVADRGMPVAGGKGCNTCCSCTAMMSAAIICLLL